MAPKLTLDGGLLREDVLLPAVQTLKTWEAEGKVELFESDRAKETPSAQPAWGVPGKPHSKFRVARKSDPSGASFQRISAVLFPHRDSMRLNMTEVNHVAHLQRHHSQGRNIFVTTDVANFISGGKREQLRTAFKIMILTPEEAVQALQHSEGLAAPEKKKRAASE